jgi:hypothetical protein
MHPQAGATIRSTLQGKPTFSFVCVKPGRRRLGTTGSTVIGLAERLRVSDTAADFDGRAAGHVVRVKYSHLIALPGLRTPSGDQLDFANSRGGANRDGPGIDAYLDALQTLRPGASASAPASPSAPSSNQEDKGVPLLR